MSWKLNDYACHSCGFVQEHMTEAPAPEVLEDECKSCGHRLLRKRSVQRFARYTGEHARQQGNIPIAGGKFDTMGARELPPLPEFEGDRIYREKVQELIDSGAPVREAMDAAEKHMPSDDDQIAHVRSPEFKESYKERRNVAKQNRMKQMRQAAIDAGAANLRDNPLPGDHPAVHSRS